MDFTNGLDQLKNNLNKKISHDALILKDAFDKVKGDLIKFVSDSAGAYRYLQAYSSDRDIPKRGNEPEGFIYGVETIPSINPQEKILFPLIHAFQKVGATAIEENGNCASFLFNFALRSIISYPLGDSIVYMIDSNVSGDFNALSPICTEMGDTESEKNMFHYITTYQSVNEVLNVLDDIMDKNIRNHISRYPDLYSYNRQNPMMHEPYHFLFVRNIQDTLSDKQQIDKLARLIHSQNASKAGVYIFYSYDKNKLDNQEDSYFSDINKAVRNLLNISYLLDSPRKLFPEAELSLEPRATIDIVHKVINFVSTQKLSVSLMSFSNVIQKELASGSLWKSPFKGQKNHLYIPVGFQNATTLKEIDFNFRDSSPHAFIGGKTGSGKSILLHNLIINGALRYSPEKLQFFLADMKGGVSFALYKDLPHVVALCASSNRHYVESLLELFCLEIERRSSLFKSEGVTSLDDYNDLAERNNKATLPYLFCIIDEFQELFSVIDIISNKAKIYIEKIHKKGRSGGIFLALCTQSAPSDISRDQVGIKLSLFCDPKDSIALIGNDGAAYLRGKGKAILNSHPAGEEKYNQQFQVAYIDELKELPEYVKQIKQIYLKQNNGVDKYDHLVYDDRDLSARLSDNPSLMNEANQPDSLTPYIYIGIPCFYRKEHVKFCFHRDSQSNVAICGSDRETALRLVGIIAIQFLHLYKRIGTKLYISDLQKQTESTYNKLEFLSKEPNVSHSGSANLKNTLDEVYQILCHRKQNVANSVSEPEVLYALLDLKPDGNFSSSNSIMVSFSGSAEVTPMSKLKELIENGPDYGIHVLVYCYNSANMNIIQFLLNRMEIKIALRGGNSSTLLITVGSKEIIDQYGKGFIRMPEEMGLKYLESDSYGDPFLIYNTIGDRKFENTVWDTLFMNLPNKDY